MANTSMDLEKVFSAVEEVLAQKRTDLNQADDYNHNHGDNMVKTFELMTQAVRERRETTLEDQLEHASQLVQTQAESGSAQLYSKGLANAAATYKGKQLTADNSMEFIATLMGALQPSNQAPSQTNDIAASLLSGLMGGQQPSSSSSQDPLGGLAGSLLSNLLGGSDSSSTVPQERPENQLGLSDLLQAGMSLMQTDQQGTSSIEPLIQAILSASPMKESSHRQQSGNLIANTLVKVLGSMLNK